MERHGATGYFFYEDTGVPSTLPFTLKDIIIYSIITKESVESLKS